MIKFVYWLISHPGRTAQQRFGPATREQAVLFAEVWSSNRPYLLEGITEQEYWKERYKGDC